MAGAQVAVATQANGTSNKKMSKNQYRREMMKKKKAQDQAHETEPVKPSVNGSAAESSVAEADDGDASDAFDMVAEIPTDNPLYSQFKSVFTRFEEEGADTRAAEKGHVYYEDEDDGIQSEDEEAETKKTISKKKRREQGRLSVAELKAMAKKPDLVEWTDPYSTDAGLLIGIKSTRNIIPIPGHWNLKREYLSAKRGIEKPMFQLPKFIADTGIGAMRDAELDKQKEQTLKQKQRERVAPKMGRLDIDYSKLYEAFFRFQTKPELTRYGEVYYEGKEYETNLKHLKPGELSDEIREALNMSPGQPPPWLLHQQRFGPPPAYPILKVPGLNAPPPPGQNWGFHPGGYGKPPVDEHNRPLYGGDIFGTEAPHPQQYESETVDRSHWGELEELDEDDEEEEEERDDEEEDEDDEADADPDELAYGAQGSGVRSTVPGTASVAPSEYPGGTESVSADFSLRKKRGGTETEEQTAPRAAGRVIRETNVQSSGFFGSDRGYDLKGGRAGMPVLGAEDQNPRKRKAGDVDVSVDVDNLERDGRLSKDQLAQQYEAGRRANQPYAQRGVDEEDLSEMIAEEARKRQKKDEDRRKRR